METPAGPSSLVPSLALGLRRWTSQVRAEVGLILLMRVWPRWMLRLAHPYTPGAMPRVRAGPAVWRSGPSIALPWDEVCAPIGVVAPAASPVSFLGGCWCIGASSFSCSGPGTLEELDAECSAGPACAFIAASRVCWVGVRMEWICRCSVLGLFGRRCVLDVGNGGERCCPHCL